jgi:hypothetical protein
MTIMRLRTALALWIACALLGGALIALPDTGPRLVSFSEAHGPSWLDAIGIAIVLTGWLAYAGVLWHRRQGLARAAGSRTLAGATFLLGLGTGLVVASVAGDFPHWWIVGVALLVVVQVSAARIAPR